MLRFTPPSLALTRAWTFRALSGLSSGLLASIVLASGMLACGTPTDVSLLEIGPQAVVVNQELRLTIGIDNPAGRPVELRLENTELPGFDTVTSLAATPSGGTFRWAPLASHVGTHELVFILKEPGDGGAVYDMASALFTVTASQDAAPVFVRPGAGGTYDLSRNPCVEFDVEVQDDDTPVVDLSFQGELPRGATLANAGDKRATFDWCPSADQVAASERWTVRLVASDREHPQVERDYIIVLRTVAKEGCPGEAPVVTLVTPLAGERVSSGTTYPVQIQVTDDNGLRDPPLLYFSTEAPDDLIKPDVTSFEQVTFEEEGDGWVARIPSFGLAEGADRQVYYTVSATDNDDETGSLCDHRTDTAAVAFFAVGGAPPDGSEGQCQPCTASTECASGICAAAAAGARCVDPCAGDGVCETGACGATVTTEGATRAGCGPVDELCGGTSSGCTDDGREDNDSLATASAYTSAVTDGQICADDDDYFSFSVARNQQVTVTLDGFSHSDGDLDLVLLDPAGAIVDQSAGSGNSEVLSFCHGEATADRFLQVYGYRGDQNPYSLRVEQESVASCCVDDAFEDDDTPETARTISFASTGDSELGEFEGTVCPSDVDWVAIPMSGPGRIQVDLLFEHAIGDVDITLRGPDGAFVASATSSTDDEIMDVEVGLVGTYTLNIYGFGVENDYIGAVTRTVGHPCTATTDCPGTTVCEDNACRDATCITQLSCPSAHLCPAAGPAPAENMCTAACTVNTNCRSTEACKRFPEGRGCGRTGGGANGDSCTDFSDCGGQRVCVGWLNGYCARADCADNSDCEADTFCIDQGGFGVCALSCEVSAFACRGAEGYQCASLPTEGGPSRFVCIPPG